MLQHPIRLQRPPLPWLVRPHRQGFAALWRRGGAQWPTLTLRPTATAPRPQ
jgi:hypothetical protein